MRKAIVDTNVILNTAITSGMILVPGSLIILKQKIPGFNNILTMANYSMIFGLNNDVNHSQEPEASPPKKKMIVEIFLGLCLKLLIITIIRTLKLLLDEILQKNFNELIGRVMLEESQEDPSQNETQST